MTFIHGTCVAIQNQGVLLLGTSGAGKSDLALQLIYRGAVLVADDQVHLAADKNFLLASPPDSLAGKLEIRGIGIRNFPFQSSILLCLAIQLTSRENVERLPVSQLWYHQTMSVPLLQLHAFDLTTPLKIEIALQEFALTTKS